MSDVDRIVSCLAESTAVADKIAIADAYHPALLASMDAARLGDDCAALPDGRGGHLLFAAEGMLRAFVDDDPWFAGYSAVMVNVSDVCAMGGRPMAVVDVLWTPSHDASRELWDGMTRAAADYGVPIVGGHTTLTREDGPVYLSVSILGRSDHLLTSFDARSGDELLMVVDLDGVYRRDKPFWNASVGKPPADLQANIGLLPALSELQVCHAAKDISNGGIVGTLIMLLQCSGVGARLDLDAIPMPPDVDIARWLVSFPSFGYLLSAAREHRPAIVDLFERRGLACGAVGEITAEAGLRLRLGQETRDFWTPSQSAHDA